MSPHIQCLHIYYNRETFKSSIVLNSSQIKLIKHGGLPKQLILYLH